jgi:DNA-binding GntR family transcriptional regulator
VTRERRRRPKPADAIQQHLRNQIFSGKLRPGQWIRLEDLSDAFDVSTTPVREAVAVLVDEGLIEVRTRKGITVRPISAEEIRENFEVYAFVTGLLAERSATRLTEEQLDYLATLLRQMDELTDRESELTDREALERMEWEFHRTINRASGSNYLKNTARYLARNIPRVFVKNMEDWPVAAQKWHHEMYDALRRRDAHTARAVTEGHTRMGADMLERYLIQEGVFPSDNAEAAMSPDASHIPKRESLRRAG